MSCEYVIFTNKQELGITLMLENFTQAFNMEFEINETVINKIKRHNYDTRIKSGTKISFSTHENHNFDGACLGVYSTDQAKFDIACNRSTTSSNTEKESGGNENTSPATTETRQSTPASISHGIETTERTTLKPTHSRMQASMDNVDGDNHIKSVSKYTFEVNFRVIFFLVNKSANKPFLSSQSNVMIIVSWVLLV
ncbi:uncharacterized protein LOC132728794 [Ruditapes philippinarum]|uniref:uncharacterized protein LOC132728794 n=1 Tax=Ruditapes philippinarum TaxID=129788 RepID=UPI00295BB071|nr:uncharacterized protein LOC132728794 [Ruditapes philippinarum]